MQRTIDYPMTGGNISVQLCAAPLTGDDSNEMEISLDQAFSEFVHEHAQIAVVLGKVFDSEVEPRTIELRNEVVVNNVSIKATVVVTAKIAKRLCDGGFTALCAAAWPSSLHSIVDAFKPESESSGILGQLMDTLSGLGLKPSWLDDPLQDKDPLEFLRNPRFTRA
jgi:glycine cleavage system protein P-like pyridoxal-binding family